MGAGTEGAGAAVGAVRALEALDFATVVARRWAGLLFWRRFWEACFAAKAFAAASASWQARLAAFFACLKALRACFCSVFNILKCFRAASASFCAAAAFAIRVCTLLLPLW